MLAVLVLLPFLRKAFSVDDVTFLFQAKHVLVDPLHPTAFDMVVQGQRIRLSQEIVTGPMMAYLLLPTVLLGGAEWAAHITQLILLIAATIATASLAVRLNLNHTQAAIAALLVVASPAVLAMAGTAMPDVPAMAFAVIGMERFVAWRETRRRSAALAATLLLALGALARPQVLLLLPCAALWGLDQKAWRVPSWRASAQQVINSIWPLFLAAIVVALVVFVTRDPASGASIASTTLRRIHKDILAFNLANFAVQLVVAFPLGLLWPLVRGYRFLNVRRTVVALGIALALLTVSRNYLSHDWGWRLVAFVWAALGIDVVADIMLDTWRRRDRTQLVLLAWLLIATVSATYIHLPAKALVASTPAMAILLARHINLRERRRLEYRAIGAVVILGVVLGLLVLRADAALAEIGRKGGQVVATQIGTGRTVWMDGGWGFQWYAEQAGAQPLARTAPFPRPGDLVVESLQSRVLRESFPNKTLLYERVFAEPGGRIFNEGAGFFSNRWGLAPWVWGRGELGRIQVWRIDPRSRGAR